MAAKKKTTKTTAKKRNTATRKKKITGTNTRVGYTQDEFHKFSREVADIGDGFVAKEVGDGMISIEFPIQENMDLAKRFKPNDKADDEWLRNFASVTKKDFSEDIDLATFFGSTSSSGNGNSNGNGGVSSLQSMMYKGKFLSHSFGDPMKLLHGAYNDGREKIHLALHLNKRDHIARQVVETMAQFSNSKIILSGRPESEIKFYEKWLRRVKMRKVLSKLFRGYFGHGNVTMFRLSTPILSRNKASKKKKEQEIKLLYRDMSVSELVKFQQIKELESQGKIKEAKSIKLDKDEAARKNVWSRNQLPLVYIMVNPLNVENETPSIFGVGNSYYTVEPELIDSIKAAVSNRESSSTAKSEFKELNRFPGSFVKKVSDLEKTKGTRIKLDDSFAIQVFREKEDWEKYATPMVWTALPHLHMKNKLREMDLRTINSVVNKILKITVGSPESPATPKQMAYLSKVLKGNSKVLTLLWNHTMKAEFVEPNLSALNIEKYEPVNKDIKESFSIPDALLGGSSKGFSSTFIEVKAFIEKLNSAREDIIDEFLIPEFELIAEAMGFSDIPDIKFSEIKLRDENKIFEQGLKLADKGAKSIRTLSEETGHNWNQEKDRLDKEIKLRSQGKIPAIGVPGAGSPSGGRPEKENQDDKTDIDSKDTPPKGEGVT